MIITISSRCKGVGKTTIAVFLSKYLSEKSEVFVVDHGQNLEIFNLFLKEKEKMERPILVESVNDQTVKYFRSHEVLKEMSKSDEIFIVDLRADLGKEGGNILEHSNVIIIPFAADENVLHSTSEYSGILSEKLDENTKIFLVENFYHEGSIKYRDQIASLQIGSAILIESRISFNRDMEKSFLKGYSHMKLFKKVFEEIYREIF